MGGDSLRQSSLGSEKNAESTTEFEAKQIRTDGSKQKVKVYAPHNQPAKE